MLEGRAECESLVSGGFRLAASQLGWKEGKEKRALFASGLG